MFFVAIGAPLHAQAGPLAAAAVTYRTREIVFVAAGRAEGLSVGDTLRLLHGDTAAVGRAVVLSIAQHTGSARLVDPAATVRAGDVARWLRRAPLLADAPTAPDTAARVAPAAPPAAVAPAPVRRAAPRTRAPPAPRLRGGLQLEQIATSSGSSGLTTHQSVGSLTLQVPFGRSANLRVRETSRWRGGASAGLTGQPSLTSTIYQVELRLGRPTTRWGASLGRFVPTAAMALGYIDGAQLEWRPSRSTRFGVVGGFVPEAVRLRPSTATSRAGVYWGFGTGERLAGTIAAAADWAAGARRRTQLAGQLFWAPTRSSSVSIYGDADLGAPWDSSGGTLGALFANARTGLPFGFHGGIGVESHQSVRLWENFSVGDTLPLPGRLNGASASLGRRMAGFQVEMSGGYLHRTGDPVGTLRGSLTASRRSLYVSAMLQHGDLFDYTALMARWALPRTLGFTASLGGMATATRSRGGAVTLWRVSLRPELSRSLRNGLYFTTGGDFGRYAGQTTTWLHAGVSYRFR